VLKLATAIEMERKLIIAKREQEMQPPGLLVVDQFPVGFIASAMNVCLKARDSPTKSLDADTASGPVFKLTHYQALLMA